MTCWEVLKISPTPFKKAIKEAYITLLKVTNPEDYPEEFKLLNKAYKEALKLSKTLNLIETPEVVFEVDENESSDSGLMTGEPGSDSAVSNGLVSNSPAEALPNLEKIESIERLNSYLEELNKDKFRRWEYEHWQKVFGQPVLMDIKTSSDAELELFKFLEKSQTIPDHVFNGILLVDLDFSNNQVSLASRLGEERVQSLIDQLRLNKAFYCIDYHLIDSDLNGSALLDYIRDRREFERDLRQWTGGLDSLLARYQSLASRCPQDVDLKEVAARTFYYRGGEQVSVNLLKEMIEYIREHGLKYSYIERDASILLGNHLVREKAFFEAAPLFEKVLEADVYDSEAYKGLSQCHAASGRFEEAISLMEKALSNCPADFEARALMSILRRDYYFHLKSHAVDYMAQAELLFDLEQFDKIIQLFDQESDLKSSTSIYYGLALTKLGKAEESNVELSRVFSQLVSQGENVIDDLVQVIIQAHHVLSKGFIDEFCVPVLDQLTNKDFRYNAEVNFEIALASLIIHRELARLVGSDHEDYHRYRCEAYDSGNLAIYLYPKDAKAAFYYGFACYDINRFEESVEYFTIAADSFPYNYSLWYCMGYAYRQLENSADSLRCYERALSITNSANRRRLTLQAIIDVAKYFELEDQLAQYLEDQKQLEKELSDD